MSDPQKLPPIEEGDILVQSMQTGQAWVPLQNVSDLHSELQKGQQLMQELYNCMQRLEFLIGCK